MELLNNYRALVEKVDELTARITTAFAEHIACRRGCDGCCRHLSLSLVEAAALAVACSSLPPERRDLLRDRSRTATAEKCPLLLDGECALYSHRPLICRTHGLPVRIMEGDRARIDFCPGNFKDLETLPGAAIVDIDTLNTILAAINKVFASEYDPRRENDRLSIAEALLLDL